MIDYTLLGPVAARDGARVLDLLPQHRLLLARLVIAAGKPVLRADLAATLWEKDEKGPPDHALNRVVSELRIELRGGRSGPDPLPVRGESCCLPLDQQQADVLRFRVTMRAARASSGSQAARLMREAIREWRQSAVGLSGGLALDGITGSWAENTRESLRDEYREARLACLKQDLLDHKDEQLAAECSQLATEPEALHNELFVEYCMIATYRAGDRLGALQIYERAAAAVRLDLDISLSGRLRELAKVIRTEDRRRLDGPGNTLEWASNSTNRNSQAGRRPMSEDKVTVNFNNDSGVTVGEQIGYVKNLKIRKPAENDQADASEDGHDGKSDQELS